MIYDEYFESRQKTAKTDIRPYVHGEDVSHVSFTPGESPESGGKIARDPKNHKDQWYLSPEFFKQNYE